MRKRFIVYLWFLIFSANSFAQEIPYEATVGFGCGYAATLTEPVANIQKLLLNRNYKALRKNLYHQNPALQYLAVVSMRLLEEKGKITLSTSEKAKIAELQRSRKKLGYCAGCTDWDELTLKEALEITNSHRINYIAEKWISRTMEESR